MKPTRMTGIAVISTTALSQAATITPVDGNPSGGEGYTFHVALDPSQQDTSTMQGTVGSWSWEDSRLPGADTFWRHQSDWLAVTLTGDSTLRIQAERRDPAADLRLFPSFTIFRGINDTADGAHFGSNSGDLQWTADSQFLEYVGHHDNSTEGLIDEQLTLSAGDYTILFGGNALSEAEAVNVDYRLTLTSLPIPEPNSALILAIGGLALLKRRLR